MIRVKDRKESFKKRNYFCIWSPPFPRQIMYVYSRVLYLLKEAIVTDVSPEKHIVCLYPFINEWNQNAPPQSVKINNQIATSTAKSWKKSVAGPYNADLYQHNNSKVSRTIQVYTSQKNILCLTLIGSSNVANHACFLHLVQKRIWHAVIISVLFLVPFIFQSWYSSSIQLRLYLQSYQRDPFVLFFFHCH